MLVLSGLFVYALPSSAAAFNSNSLNYNDTQPSQSEFNAAISSFYNNQGEWAGVFRIARIDRVRLDKSGPDRFIAHVRYYYTAIPGNYKGRTDKGYDQRTFTLIRNGGGWRVINMGGYI